jgi:hypothetical protein
LFSITTAARTRSMSPSTSAAAGIKAIADDLEL